MTAMKASPALLAAGRVLLTLVIIAIALAAGNWLWIHYQVEPWTRDGRVRADIAKMAPDVSGFVTAVLVQDNQLVHAGDTLFVIDPTRYQLAVADAQAEVAAVQAQLAEAERENKRNLALGSLVSSETVQQDDAKVQELQAGLDEAMTALDLSQLNLKRTNVKARIDGYVTNLDFRPGDYFAAGEPALTLIDSDSFYVDGYFEETKLARIQVGDRARVQLMGESQVLTGYVQSITRGIADRERISDPDLLPDINPTFNWVRLAQRIPVRIALDRTPKNILLVMGRTATVEVLPNTAPGENTAK